jgi:hypothetical protein
LEKFGLPPPSPRKKAFTSPAHDNDACFHYSRAPYEIAKMPSFLHVLPAKIASGVEAARKRGTEEERPLGSCSPRLARRKRRRPK